MGRQLFPETAQRKAKEIQRLRQNQRRMRKETRRTDCRKESGNRKAKTNAMRKGLT